jgi:hypothetical protein
MSKSFTLKTLVLDIYLPKKNADRIHGSFCTQDLDKLPKKISAESKIGKIDDTRVRFVKILRHAFLRWKPMLKDIITRIPPLPTDNTDF